jgi:outer membrane protein OmpA-like peptidoglycan-associated protein
MKASVLTCFLLLGVLLTPALRAQEDTLFTRDFGIGVSGHIQSLNNDVQDNGTFFRGAKTPWTFGGSLEFELTFLRFEDILRLSATLDGNFFPTKASAEDMGGEDQITPYDVKDNILNFGIGCHSEFFPTSTLRPFLFIKLGYMMFNAEVSTPNGMPASLAKYRTPEEKGTFSMPIGVGLAFALSRELDVFASFHKVYTFTDYLDGWISEINDNFPVISLGLKYYFGGGQEKETKVTVIKTVVPTPPVVEDTDGDGLKDTDEKTIYKTDPTKKDTDGDGLMDGDEVRQYKTDPLNKDTDGDRLIDGDEVLKYKTNPLNKDTDGDGCDDGKEVLDMKSDPNKKDTDGDGLMDCDELNIYKTNPLLPDTDDDGVNDGQEVKNGTNPLKRDVLKVDENKPIVLKGVNFETNKSDILPTSEEILTMAYNTLKAYPTMKVEISGHTDDVGSDVKNQKLSENRANAVRNWLINKGIEPSRMTTVGYGKKQPMVPNTSPENRAQNRRIEFKIVSR